MENEIIYMGRTLDGKYCLLHVKGDKKSPRYTDFNEDHLVGYLEGVVASKKRAGLDIYNGLDEAELHFDPIPLSKLEEILSNSQNGEKIRGFIRQKS